MPETILCPDCGERVTPEPVGYTDEDGNWEYDHTECPVCLHVFSGEELSRKQ
jgi:rubredoxin